MKILLLTILFLSFSFNVFSKVASRNLFSIELEAPTRIAICHGDLYVLSAKNRLINQYDVKNGQLKTSTPQLSLSQREKITALGCWQKMLIFASWDVKNKVAKIYQLGLGGTVNLMMGKHPLPGEGTIKRLSCWQKSCFYLRDKLFRSLNLQVWQVVDFPQTKDIKPSKDQLKRNPFADWQRTLHVFDGRYSDLIFTKEKLWLLDSFRVKIVSSPWHALAGRKDKKHKKWGKWGKWGVWDDSMLYPKAFAFYGEDIIIADGGLKLLFRFAKNGEFKGVYGPKIGKSRFGYPIDLAVMGKKVFIADFLSNKVWAIQLTDLPEKVKGGDLRAHHFRHPEVLKNWTKIRCLNCHDGTENYSLEKLANTKFHHPVQIKWQGTPGTAKNLKVHLLQKKIVDCSSCHENHHRSISGTYPNLKGNFKKYAKLPHKFRGDYMDICLSCHLQKGQQKMNHFKLKKGKVTGVHKVASCNQCHIMHEGEQHLLRLPATELCLTCHKNNTPKSHPLEKEVGCLSCHAIHDAHKQFSFAKHNGKGEGRTCLKCHEDKVNLLGSNKHMAIISQKKVHWPKNERHCLSCHQPHRPLSTAKSKCISCHAKKISHQHQRDISIAQTNRAKDVVLDHDNKLSCITCHDPHRGTDKDKYLRPKKAVVKMCVSCHDKKNDSELYDNFHKIFKAKRKK